MKAKLIWLVPTGVAAVVAVFLLTSAALRMPGTTPEPPSGPPNVVLISIDTVRPDHLGCQGYQHDTSPNIDRLAQQGVRFARATSQMPLTMPSHIAGENA